VDLDVSTHDQDGIAVVSAAGEIDVFTAPQLDSELSAVTSGGQHRVVVDLSRVDFLDSTGLAVLVKTLKRVREHDGGSLAVVVTADRVAKVFRLTGLDTLIPLHPTVESAVAG
jgi:anti-sigma B factor antagonist